MRFENVKRVKCRWPEDSTKAVCSLDIEGGESKTARPDSLRLAALQVTETFDKTIFFAPRGKFGQMECDLKEGQLRCQERW